jgi:anaerobic selenocysteine-containing dehydrogenase
MFMTATSLREEKSFCRICTGLCGTIVTLDEQHRVVAVRGDKDDPQTMGYICSKGASAPDFHNSPQRLLHPLKRMPDGRFVKIPLGQALQEIGDRFVEIVNRDGPEAVATFRGSGGFFPATVLNMLPDWLAAIGSPKNYSTLTIDQSAKTLGMARLGFWGAGKHRVQYSDVALLIGANPLVSITQLDCRHPLKRIKEHKARGLKSIIIDPRRTETAKFADIFVQPLPGHDAAIVGSILRTIFKEGWHDGEFCEKYVADLAALRAAVEPFNPESVARQADIPVSQIREVAVAFARDGKIGIASSGTGPDMARHSNMTEHLIECLNVVCGRFIRVGEKITNIGFLFPNTQQRAQVMHLPRTWESEPKNRINGFGLLCGEMATSAMADDIARPGPGQIRFLLNHGGNPANCVPDQLKMTKALQSLELMVTVDPFMTPSAELSHYVIPPKLMYERADLPMHIFETILFPTTYTRYTPKLSAVPRGSDLCDDWQIFWYLAKRLGKTLHFHGVPLNMETQPRDEEVLAIVGHKAVVPWDEIKSRPDGYFYEADVVALPADPANTDKFTTMPADVKSELDDFIADKQVPGAVHSNGQTFAFLLSSRRQRHRFNTVGYKLPGLRRAMPYNVGYLNPSDMLALNIADGHWIEISSDHGTITVVVEADDSVRRGVVSLCHGFGTLPGRDDYLNEGVSPNILISTDRNLQTINGTPRMSAIPVNIRAANRPPAQ